MLDLLFKRSRGGHQESELDQVLAQLAASLPEVRWIALLNPNGVVKGHFPHELAVDQEDRISAMGAAMCSLGERVSKELDGGDLHYTLVAGQKSLNLLVVLSKGLLLSLGLHPHASPDSVLSVLQKSVGSLLDVLKIEKATT